MTTLLIVDNDPDTLARLNKYFSAKGYRIVTSVSGKEAIEKVRREFPDLILLNVQLPDINGCEVCREVRRNWRTSWIPVIFLSELKERDSRINGFQAGAIDYLTKPFDIEELWLRVRNALNRASFNNLIDPITSLPGDQLLEQELQKLLSRKNWGVFLLTLTGLENFAERYGFVSRNEVLRAAALLLGKAVSGLGSHEDFIGDAGEGSFVVITGQETVEKLEPGLIPQLTQLFLNFYPLADREGISAGWENGPGRAAPTLELFAGCISSDGRDFRSPQDILAAARARQKIAARVPR